MRPGPKPDPSKPNSRYNPDSHHGGQKIACGRGHLFTEGSYTTRSDGRRRCLVCQDELKGPNCKNGHPRAEFENEYGACRECSRLKGKAQRLAYKYKLTVEQVEIKLFNQDYECAICHTELDLEGHNGVCIDHDHTCCPGEKTCGQCVREILCNDCNQLLGRAKDSPEILLAAIKYLERNR